MDAEKRLALKKLEKRLASLLDATLAALYTASFGIALYASGYPLNTIITLVAIHTMLSVLGWRNPPINVREGRCILYRTGFLPVFAAIFTLAAWVYRGAHIGADYVAAMIAGFSVAYVSYKTLAYRIAGAEIVTGVATGLTVFALAPKIDSIPISFSLSQVASAAARPGMLCDRRPALYVIGLYSVATDAALLLALTRPTLP